MLKKNFHPNKKTNPRPTGYVLNDMLETTTLTSPDSFVKNEGR